MNCRPLITALALAAGIVAPAAAQQNFDTIQIRTTPVAGSVYMLTGSGGNIGLSIGADGPFMVDDQYAPLTDKIRAAVAELSDRPIRFVLNTHWHGDHTGGNENLGEAGTLIVAHDNVRRRMSVEQIRGVGRTTPASPAAALPVITFDATSTFYFNGDTIHAVHVPHAHTDGDALIHFRGADVIHMGDTFFNGMYPFIDTGSGGAVNGIIAAAEHALGYAGAGTRIIPGHGPLSDRAGLQAYHDMLVTVRDRIRSAKAEGNTLEQVQQMQPTAEFDAEWGGGFISPERLIESVYQSLP